MPPFIDIFLYYFVGAMLPGTGVLDFTMRAKRMDYADIPVTLVKKYKRNALVLLSQVLAATLLFAHEFWQLNLLLAIESAIFGLYESRWLLSWLTHSGRFANNG